MRLTQPQKAAIMRAEPTLYGEESIAICHGRTANRLRAMGLATGNPPHLYLTQEGRALLPALLDGEA